MKLPPLHDNQRAASFRWGSLLVLGACALAPAAGAPELSASDTVPSLNIPNVATPQPYRGSGSLAVLRDPFVPTVVQLPRDTHVEAVILGERPQALVLVRGRTAIVGIGDVLAGERVVRIDDAGVVLANAERLPLGSTR